MRKLKIPKPIRMLLTPIIFIITLITVITFAVLLIPTINSITTFVTDILYADKPFSEYYHRELSEQELEIYNANNNAVISIYANSKKDFIGSGFIITKNGIAMTASHVLDSNKSSVYVKLTDESWNKITHLYFYDRKNDVAIFQLQKRKEPYPFLEIGRAVSIVALFILHFYH